jgi:hypothetical protein
MKKILWFHWTLTALFALLMSFSAFLYLSKSPQMLAGMGHLGYPPYLLGILGTAKALGILAILQTRFTTLREWAYAGFTINLIGASWSHLVNGDPITMVIVSFALLAGSYGTWKFGLLPQSFYAEGGRKAFAK